MTATAATRSAAELLERLAIGDDAGPRREQVIARLENHREVPYIDARGIALHAVDFAASHPNLDLLAHTYRAIAVLGIELIP